MFLFELFNTDPLTVRLVAVTSQLVSAIDSGSQHAKWTVDELLDYFKINDIIVDKTDLYDMIQKPPLNHSIANIEGEKVIFKGQETPVEPDQAKSQKVVQQMAQHAMK